MNCRRAHLSCLVVALALVSLVRVAAVAPVARAQPTQAPDAPAVPPVSSSRSHDWRAPGYVGVVGGRNYDPWCRPLTSVGINVPNLLYRPGWRETLEWMRNYRLRWLRVFATGHAIGSAQAPRDATAAAEALGWLLDEVEAFNARHDPSEAIYVLVSLTDYYPPGVPGDRHAFDHPTFRESPVLPAPWFRAGVRGFGFDQEHDLGKVVDLPNYEVHYKPWVQTIVASAADRPVLLGWQLGNELKARGSPRNGIGSDQAYDWYLAFTRDVVDTIRAIDRHHPIFVGAQYVAELTDWEYRPQDQLRPDLVPEYRRLMRRMLDACGQYCWNVWSLTAYDFNPYPLDDAMLLQEAGVAVVVTEHGFTRGTQTEMQRRFGGDRVVAVREGIDRPWQGIDGQIHPRQLGVSDLVERLGLDGVAPWGSPAPGPGVEFDADPIRGIAGAPDEYGLWAAWTEVAARLEEANRSVGPSSECLAFRGSDTVPSAPPFDPIATWYFAEGSTQPPFDTWFLVQNPTGQTANVRFTFQLQGGEVVTHDVTVGPNSRFSVFANQVLPNQAFSTRIDADQQVFAERSTFVGFDGTVVPGIAAPNRTWLFAEGSTQDPFHTWLLLQNPSSEPATATITYLPVTGLGDPVTQTVSLPPRSRTSVFVNTVLPNQAFAIRVESDLPIVVERAMYRFPGNATTVDAGVHEPGRIWYFADGRTTFFRDQPADTWLLLYNPNTFGVNAAITCFSSEGVVQTGQRAVPALSRTSYLVSQVCTLPSYGILVEATGEIVAERAVFVASPATGDEPRGVYATPGTPRLDTDWLLPEGSTDLPFFERILVLNPHDLRMSVRIELMRANGEVVVRELTIDPRRRTEIDVNTIVPSSAVSARVITDLPSAVERVMFWTKAGQMGFHNAVGIPLP